MSALILDYRNHKKPKEAWSNMERLHLMRKQGLIPALDGVDGVLLVDTAPSEITGLDDLSYRASDGDVA